MAVGYYTSPFKSGHTITSPFGKKRSSGAGRTSSGWHTGVDFVPRDPSDKGVRPIGDGRVVKTKYTTRGWGEYVVVHHEYDNMWTLYGHLARGSTRVKEGDYVNNDVILGTMGSTGNSTGPHLHVDCRIGKNEGALPNSTPSVCPWLVDVNTIFSRKIGGMVTPTSSYNPSIPTEYESAPDYAWSSSIGAKVDSNVFTKERLLQVADYDSGGQFGVITPSTMDDFRKYLQKKNFNERMHVLESPLKEIYGYPFVRKNTWGLCRWDSDFTIEELNLILRANYVTTLSKEDQTLLKSDKVTDFVRTTVVPYDLGVKKPAVSVERRNKLVKILADADKEIQYRYERVENYE